MGKTEFAKTVIARLDSSIGKAGGSYGESCAADAMNAVAQGITEYLLRNVSVTVAYAGIIPGTPPSPDPVVTDTFKIVGTCAPTGPSANFDDWIRLIESNIINGFSLAPLGNSGVSFPAKPFLVSGITTSRDRLASLHGPGDRDPQLKVWEEVCGGILEWLTSVSANLTPGAASRPSGPSSGTASITGITID